MLETSRLLLGRWTDADLAPYASLCADPEVMRWIGDGRPRGDADSAAEVRGLERETKHPRLGFPVRVHELSTAYSQELSHA